MGNARVIPSKVSMNIIGVDATSGEGNRNLLCPTNSYKGREKISRLTKLFIEIGH